VTNVFGIVGDPVEQARSPEVFNELFHAHRIDAVMVPLHVSSGDFQTALAGLLRVQNLGGLVITIPHKFAAASLLSSASHRAKVVGAANALRRTDDGWDGDLFDGEGFARGVEARHGPLAGQRCAIVGAGGAGAAIALALIDRSISELRIFDLDHARAASLEGRLAAYTGIPITVGPPTRSTDIAINASPAGMSPLDRLPFEPAILRSGALVCEVVMKPAKTNLLIEAERLGYPVHEGRHMLDFQVAAIWEFFGLQPYHPTGSSKLDGELDQQPRSR